MPEDFIESAFAGVGCIVVLALGSYAAYILLPLLFTKTGVLLLGLWGTCALLFWVTR